MTAYQKQCLLAYMQCLNPESVDGLWGPMSAKATENMQKKLGLEADGIWGDATDAAIREYIFSGTDLEQAESADNATDDFWDEIRYWTREEFMCRCGEYHSPYCSGYPVEPDETLVRLLDDIRTHFGRPAHRSSGIRCPQHNLDSGGVYNSKHLTGKAMDFYVEGTSGEAVRTYAAADPRCNYTYVIEGNYVHVDVE